MKDFQAEIKYLKKNYLLSSYTRLSDIHNIFIALFNDCISSEIIHEYLCM